MDERGGLAEALSRIAYSLSVDPRTADGWTKDQAVAYARRALAAYDERETAEPVAWEVENRERGWDIRYTERQGAIISAGNRVNTGRIRPIYCYRGDPEQVEPTS